MEKLEHLVLLLTGENREQNLVAARSLEEVWLRHIADSVQLLDHVLGEGKCWLDMGSGAGFPGLVLAIARPGHTLHLVESRRRRVAWLARAIDMLGLDNCTLHGRKLEHVSSFPADVITARAFAPFAKLIDLSARFSTDATRWVLPKGRSASQELDDLPLRHRSLFHVEQSATDAHAGIVVGSGQIRIRS